MYIDQGGQRIVGQRVKFAILILKLLATIIPPLLQGCIGRNNHSAGIFVHVGRSVSAIILVPARIEAQQRLLDRVTIRILTVCSNSTIGSHGGVIGTSAEIAEYINGVFLTIDTVIFSRSYRIVIGGRKEINQLCPLRHVGMLVDDISHIRG